MKNKTKEELLALIQAVAESYGSYLKETGKVSYYFDEHKGVSDYLNDIKHKQIDMPITVEQIRKLNSEILKFKAFGGKALHGKEVDNNV